MTFKNGDRTENTEGNNKTCTFLFTKCKWKLTF